MGTWGPGNLENDAAHDELFTRSELLVGALMDRARRRESREADEYDHTTLFVEFEILFAWEKNGLLAGHSLPLPDEVEELMVGFLRDWDAYIDGLAPKADYKRDRRATIKRTFRRFQRICRKHAEFHGRL